MAKYDLFGEYKPHYEASVWVYDGKSDLLLFENFTTKRKALVGNSDYFWIV